MRLDNILVFLALGALLIATGYSLLSWSLRWDRDVPLSLRFGAAWFIGVGFSVAVVRCLAALTSRADLAVWATLVISAVICVVGRKALGAFARDISATRSILLVLLAALVYLPVHMAYWAPGGNDPSNPFASIGSLHSVRYAWIANYIAECRVIPVLGQNTGQSILAFMMGQAGARGPYLFLYLSLLSSIVFLGVFIYGFVRLTEVRAGRALYAVMFVLLGSTALSVTHVLVIDSGSPFALGGYTDTLFGVFSVLMLMLCQAALQKRLVPSGPLGVLVLIICIGNFLMAPQNMVFLGLLTPLLVLSAIRRKAAVALPLFWIGALALATLIAIPQGGMLTPAFMRSNIDFAGLMTPAGTNGNPARSGLHVLPGVPYYFGSSADWRPGQLALWKEAQGYTKDIKNNAFPLMWIFEQVLWTSLRILFFPMLGLYGLYRLYRDKGASRPPEAVSLVVPVLSPQQTFAVAIYLFGIGFVISFFLMLGSFKWELSRFLIPGMALGMLGLATAALEYSKRRGPVMATVALVSVLIGPLLGVSSNSIINARDWAAHRGDDVRMATLLGSGPAVDLQSCPTR